MNKFVMVMGISGAGKTTEAIKKAVPLKAKVVSSDRIREELLGDINDQTQNERVFNEMKRRTIRALKNGENIVYDATNLSAKHRINLLKELDRAVAAEYEKHIFVVLASFDECVKRQHSRLRKVPEEVIRRQICQFQCPYYYEGWDSINLVYNSPNVPLEWFVTQNQIPHDNSFHTTFTIDEHMASAYFEMLGQHQKSETLLSAARFHDIGKYFTKELGSRGNVTYYNHQNVSAYFFLLDRVRTEMRGVVETLYAAVLIQFHMEFYTRNKRGLENLAAMLGENLWNDLKLLNKCDIAAH